MASELKLEYMFGSTSKSCPGEILPTRTLSDFELVLLLEGSAVYIANSTEYHVPAGGIILGRPGTQEKCIWDTQQISRQAYFHFKITSAPDDWPPFEQWPRVITSPPAAAAPLFEHILIHIKEHPEWPLKSPERMDANLVETLLDMCLEQHSDMAANFERELPEPLRKAVKWMREFFENTPDKKIELDTLAKAACISSKHLCRLFQQHLTLSPMQAVKVMRMQLALSLLIRTNLTIKEIAERCGFKDQYYFSRAFKQVYSIAPTSAREEISRGHIPNSAVKLPKLLTHIYW